MICVTHTGKQTYLVNQEGDTKPGITSIRQISFCSNKSDLVFHPTPLPSPLLPVCDEKPNSILETGTRISFFQSHVRDGNENFSLSISCSRREREFLFLNLVLRDENENFIFQSRASRRERESRLRQFSREFSGITFFAFFID